MFFQFNQSIRFEFTSDHATLLKPLRVSIVACSGQPQTPAGSSKTRVVKLKQINNNNLAPIQLIIYESK